MEEVQFSSLPQAAIVAIRRALSLSHFYSMDTAKAQLKLAKTLWGVDDANDSSRWPKLFERIKSEGFSASAANSA